MTRAHYLRRFERLIDYIYDNLDQSLDQLTMSEVACISPYHLHRVYQGIYGESISATVKRLRLQRAAYQLVSTDLTVKQIADQSGYTSVQSFTRAFSESFEMPPARYRREGHHTQYSHCPKSEQGVMAMHEVRFETIEALEMVGIRHQGSYMEIGGAFEKLIGWLGMKGLLDHSLRTIGIFCDDPSVVETDQLRSVACASFQRQSEVELEEPLGVHTVDGGEYAVLRYKGSYANMSAAYEWFYGQWLPQSGREPRDAPCFEEYLNNPREVAPADLLTDIYMPLKATA